MLTAEATIPIDSVPAGGGEGSVALRETPPKLSGPMRSLFWRIFLWFWLATLTLAGAVAVTIYITDPDQFFPRGRFVPLQLIDRLGGASVEVFEKQGKGALRDYLLGLPRSPETKRLPQHSWIDGAYLFDADSGQELAGQKPATSVGELVTRASLSPDLQWERHIGRMLMAHAAGGNRRYVFLVSIPRSSLLLPTTPQASFDLAAAVITSALVCYWLARSVVTPVRDLQAAARRLAGGDLTTRVSSAGGLAGRRDEFSELARDFDEMAMRIEDLVTAQRRLVADISHELGSPLTRVNVALGLAYRKANDAVRPELERIEREAGRLNELIGQLLLISELENRDQSEPVESIDLPAMVREVAADAEFEASSRRCRVRVEAASPIRVDGVRHLLRSAVENVVRNAVRYTAADSEVLIELGLVEVGDHARVRVLDRGPGVPASSLGHLFRPFYRVSEARDRLTGGTGLGLAITRQAVEAHGGTVRAANRRNGGLLVEIELQVRGPG